MVGDRPTIADFSLAGYMFFPAEEHGYDWAKSHPNIHAWTQRLQRPARLEGPLRAAAGPAHRAEAVRGRLACRLAIALWREFSTMVVPVPSGVLISPVYPPSSDDLNSFSHLGGVPSLPEGMEWPRAPDGAALHFLAQIDLSTLPASGIVDFQGKPLPEFPREGALYFFADCATYGLWKQPRPRTAFSTHRTAETYARCSHQPISPPTTHPTLAFSPARITHIHGV